MYRRLWDWSAAVVPLTSTHSSWLHSINKNCVWTISVRLHHCSSCCCCCTAVHCTRKTVSGRCISLMTWRYRANCLRHFERSCRDNKTAQTTRMSQTFEWDIHRLPSSLSHIYQPPAVVRYRPIMNSVVSVCLLPRKSLTLSSPAVVSNGHTCQRHTGL